MQLAIDHMASMIPRLVLALWLFSALVSAQLSSTFYSATCPNLQQVVRSAMTDVVRQNPRNAAFILRLFFHDCFVNGCDASILLDGTPAFASEKFANPNRNSAQGYEIIDAIKARVEANCPATVSCADVLALATRDGVALLGGPTWTVRLGRRDSLAAYQENANRELPAPFSDLSVLISMFRDKGLTPREMTALSGAHTIGQAQCSQFDDRIYNDRNINATFAALRRRTCPPGGSSALAPLDGETPYQFDNGYYRELVARRGLLQSDQALFNGGSQDALVRRYSVNGAAFARDFAAAMVKMGAIRPPPGTPGEVRLVCNRVN
ncbi:peroxidase P7-like [Zingiber officinale]|uniref:peroxidase P7-like n=1 Tax=Zingiber officinale TaxID=94328 RepID=UPI001C4DB251|nr:peroxidase P7-like [Zingiber officinale]